VRSLGVSRLDGKEDEIRRFLELGVSKTAIAKLTGVSRTALYSLMSTRGPARTGRITAWLRLVSRFSQRVERVQITQSRQPHRDAEARDLYFRVPRGSLRKTEARLGWRQHVDAAE